MGCQRLIQLSLGSLVGGTKYRGEFEKRMEKLLKELSGLREEVGAKPKLVGFELGEPVSRFLDTKSFLCF